MEGSVVFHELSHTVVFLKEKQMITVTIKATDGSNQSKQIAIMGLTPQTISTFQED